jgi:sodium pump decarboxylase gamma subunit
MLLEGVRLMVVGMLTVFAFLTLLVALMRASAAFFEAQAHRFPEDGEGPSERAPGGRDEEVAVVLAVAEALRRGQRI